MRDWHCEPLLRLTNYSIPPCLMPSTLDVGDCMAVGAEAYGVVELQWGMELIVSEPIYRVAKKLIPFAAQTGHNRKHQVFTCPQN
jgi:hypothetical protein